MNIDWFPWVIRAVLIVVGIAVVIMVLKRNREGVYQGQYYIGIFVIGITASILAVISLVVSLITDLSFFYSLYLIVAGAIALLVGLVARKIWKKNR